MRNLRGCQATASASLQQPHVKKRIGNTHLNGVAWLVYVFCCTLIEGSMAHCLPLICDGKFTHRLNRSVKQLMIHCHHQFSTVGSISVTIVVLLVSTQVFSHKVSPQVDIMLLFVCSMQCYEQPSVQKVLLCDQQFVICRT